MTVAPLALCERLAALVPLPGVHLVRSAGCGAPHSGLRGAMSPTSRQTGGRRRGGEASEEQEHRGVKRVTRPMLGFQSFTAAQSTLTCIEHMPMMKKRQMVVEERTKDLTAAEQFYILAASSSPPTRSAHPKSSTHQNLRQHMNFVGKLEPGFS